MITISQLRQFTLGLSFTKTDMSFLNFLSFILKCIAPVTVTTTGQETVQNLQAKSNADRL